jgi:hypothetical protein
MTYTYGHLLRDLAIARADLPVRVRLANGQVRDLAAAELDVEVEIKERSARERSAEGADDAGLGEPGEVHRPVAVILTIAGTGDAGTDDAGTDDAGRE